MGTEFKGSYKLQGWFSKHEWDSKDGMVVAQWSTHSLGPRQAFLRCQTTAHWLVSRGCYKLRIVAMPEGAHPKDFSVAYECGA